MSTAKRQQQTLTDFFSTKKCPRSSHKQVNKAREILKRVAPDLEEIQAKKIQRRDDNVRDAQPAFVVSSPS